MYLTQEEYKLKFLGLTVDEYIKIRIQACKSGRALFISI